MLIQFSHTGDVINHITYTEFMCPLANHIVFGFLNYIMFLTLNLYIVGRVINTVH